jgi:4-hydroxybenzoyl-CoA reductase subunit beta
MMRLPVFRLHRPTSMAEALETIAASEGPTRVVAGGTDLWPNMKRRHQSAADVVSLRSVEELRGIRGEAGGEVRIGAMTTLSEVAASPVVRSTLPALARAVESISSPAIRNVASLGGNLCLDTRCTYYNQNQEWRESIDFCMKEGGTVCWVAPQSPRCWAVSSSDAAPVLCALDARVRLLAPTGDERELPLADLYEDDGIDYLTKRPDEILTDIVIPAPDGLEISYWKLRRRGSIDFAVLTVAAAVRRNADGTVEDARIWLGAVASAPVCSDAAARELIGQELTAEVIAGAARAARKVATPLDNTDFTLQWRSKMVVAYVEAALREIAGLSQERLSPKHAT